MGSQPHNTTASAYNALDLRELTVEQAMADYAWFIQKLRQRLGCTTGQCPIVTFGGSYGGMLVAWFRQKYPQLTVGGVGSAAIIDFYPRAGRQQVLWNVTRRTFEASGGESCGIALDSVLSVLRAHAATASGR